MTKLKPVLIPRFCGYDITYSYGEGSLVNLTISRGGRRISIDGHFSTETQQFLWEFGNRPVFTDLLEPGD